MVKVRTKRNMCHVPAGLTRNLSQYFGFGSFNSKCVYFAVNSFVGFQKNSKLTVFCFAVKPPASAHIRLSGRSREVVAKENRTSGGCFLEEAKHVYNLEENSLHQISNIRYVYFHVGTESTSYSLSCVVLMTNVQIRRRIKWSPTER